MSTRSGQKSEPRHEHPADRDAGPLLEPLEEPGAESEGETVGDAPTVHSDEPRVVTTPDPTTADATADPAAAAPATAAAAAQPRVVVADEAAVVVTTQPSTLSVARVEEEKRAYKARYVMAAIRIGLGFVFLWAFLDKTFGLGYATAREDAWINGGSPTFGYLNFATEGKTFHEFFKGLSGTASDWFFMVGLLGIGIALILGIGMRIAAVTGSILLMAMYAATWPLVNNPVLDDHILYTAALIAVTLYGAGRTWGFGRMWERRPFVQRNHILM